MVLSGNIWFIGHKYTIKITYMYAPPLPTFCPPLTKSLGGGTFHYGSYRKSARSARLTRNTGRPRIAPPLTKKSVNMYESLQS